MNFWLIDDNETDAVFGQIVVERAVPGARVRAFESALQALEELQQPLVETPAVILLDINMPRMNGFEFLAAYERLPAELRAGIVLLMVSSSPLHSDRDKARSYACVRGYLTKPIVPEHVVSALFDAGARP